MGILFHFLGSMRLSPFRESVRGSLWQGWTTWLSRNRRLELELEQSRIKRTSFLVVPLSLCLYRELCFAARNVYRDYIVGKKDEVLSGFHSSNVSTPWEWSIWGDKIFPALFKYNATLLTMFLYKSAVAMFVSQITLHRLSQHPYERALVLGRVGSDRLSVAFQVLPMSLWSNALFFLSSSTVHEIMLFHSYRKEYQWSRARRDELAEERATRNWVKSSWEVLFRQTTGFLWSAVGASLGSVVLPGWGTLFGMGAGEEFSKSRPVSEPPSFMLRLFPKLQHCFSTKQTEDEPSINANELLCGCCQVNYFSADANHPMRTPISSRACDHTICKSCVDMCHLASMKRSNIFCDTIKCPLCNEREAFCPYNPIINRSLCDAISLIEKSGYIVKSCDIEIDAATVEKLGRLTRLGTSRSTYFSADTNHSF